MSALVAVVPKLERAEADGHAWPNVVAQGHGAQKSCSVDAKLFSGRQSGGNDGAARMRLRKLVGIVGFVRMCQHAVDERRLQRTGSQFRRDDRGSLVSCIVARELKRRASRRQV